MMREFLYNDEKINLDSGILFGRGVFETILVKKEPIFLNEHIKRLNDSLKILHIGDVIDIGYIKDKIKELNINNCVLKIVVTEKNILFQTRKLSYKKEDYIKGFSLKLASCIRNSKAKSTYIKSISFLDNILEREDAIKLGFNEVLFLNEKGFLAEGSFSNIFIVKDKKIYTPPVHSGLLPGILRDYIIKNNEVIKREITLDEVKSADEIFITNSLVGVMWVNRFEERIIKENNISNKIKSAYEESIEI